MFSRIKAIVAIKKPSIFDKIILSMAVIGSIALVISTS